MAIWQWNMHIVPEKEVNKHFPTKPEYLDLEWFESIRWWLDVNEMELRTFFNDLLPSYNDPRAKNSSIWGDVASDTIQISFEDGRIEDIWIRIDLRDLNLDLLDCLVSYSKAKNFLIYATESKRFLKPVLSEVVEEIRRSRKMSFVRDPKLFFDRNQKYLEKINKENARKRNLK
jgi:hypothetical protein